MDPMGKGFSGYTGTKKEERDGVYTGHEYDNQPKQGITLSPIQWKMGVSPIVSFCLE